MTLLNTRGKCRDNLIEKETSTVHLNEWLELQDYGHGGQHAAGRVGPQDIIPSRIVINLFSTENTFLILYILQRIIHIVCA